MATWTEWTTSQLPVVLIGVGLLAGAAALVGCFTYLRHRSLAADAVAHALLPGLCLGYLLAGERSLPALLAGGFATGWLALVLHERLTRRLGIRPDTSIAVVLSVFFGAGTLLLSHIQQLGTGTAAGLDHFLFGSAATMVEADVALVAGVAAVVLAVVAVCWRALWLLSFDAQYARVIGLPVRLLEGLLTLLTVGAVVAGVQVVGVVLMAALLAIPAVAARSWSNRLGPMLGLAAVIGVGSAVGGVLISAGGSGRPTGPWVVLVLAGAALVSLLFAPGQGLVARSLRQRSTGRRLQNENVLKGFWILHERGEGQPFAEAELVERGLIGRRYLAATLRRLRRGGWVRQADQGWAATAAGLAQGQRIADRHRLWERWMARHLQLPDDHLHAAAEALEHARSPNLDEQLRRDLGEGPSGGGETEASGASTKPQI